MGRDVPKDPSFRWDDDVKSWGGGLKSRWDDGVKND